MTTPEAAPLLRATARDRETWTAALALPPRDAYLSDQPLDDQVPAMALACALLELARETATLDAEHARLGLDLEFPTFCDPGAPVALRAQALHNGLALEAEQGGRVVAVGELTVDLVIPADPTEPTPGLPHLPADPASVRRGRLDNVLVTGMATVEGERVVAFRRPGPGHRLAAPTPRPEAVLEAALQFATLLCHAEFDLGADTHLLPLALHAQLPHGHPDPLLLRWEPGPAPEGRARLGFAITAADAEVVGRVGVDVLPVTPAAYGRLRGRAASA